MIPLLLPFTAFVSPQRTGTNSSLDEAARLRAALGLPTVSVPPPASPALAAAESQRVVEFARAAATGRDGVLDRRALGDGEPKRAPDLDSARGMRAYRVGERIVWVEAVSGLVAGSAGGTDHGVERPARPRTDRKGRRGLYPVQRLVSDDEAKALAARFFAATGTPYGIQTLGTTDQAGGNGDDVAVDFVPTYRKVPFDDAWAGHVEIDRETGRLDVLLLLGNPPSLPDPPRDVLPGVSADDAHLVALSAAAKAGTPVADLTTPQSVLCIGRLDRRVDPRSSYAFTQADHDDAVAGHARLVYDVRLVGLGARAPSMYVVLVDAHDGRLLQVSQETHHPLTAAGKPKSAPPFLLARGVRPWRVSDGDAPWSAPAFATLVSAPSDGFAPARKLLLTDGKLAFQAGVDPATGRIGLDGPAGKTQVYQPGPALADLLKAHAKR